MTGTEILCGMFSAIEPADELLTTMAQVLERYPEHVWNYVAKRMPSASEDEVEKVVEKINDGLLALPAPKVDLEDDYEAQEAFFFRGLDLRIECVCRAEGIGFDTLTRHKNDSIRSR